MKILSSFFLLFFYLSIIVFGIDNNLQTLYLWKNSNGDFWRNFGDKKIHSLFKGEVKDGKPNGFGIVNYPNGNNYKGDFLDGMEHGFGTLFFLEGHKYEGEFKYGLQHGEGKVTWSNGKKFVGEFIQGDFWNGKQYDNNSNLKFIIRNGRKVDLR